MPEQRTVRGYVDGFNLYKGALANSPHKWLDLAALCDRLAGERVDRVAYCTATLVDLPGNPSARTRQQAYLRALGGNPRIDVFMGKFSRRTPRLHRIPDPQCECCTGVIARRKCACCNGRTIQVIKFEEKGSDVQLAVQLVKDASFDLYETAIVISNDSDLQPAIDAVEHHMGKRVMVVSPRKTGRSLHGSLRGHLSKGLLTSSQMPETVLDLQGYQVTKPSMW